MSTFSKQVTVATTEMKQKAKQVARRHLLLKHPAVKAAFEKFPLKMRSMVTLVLSEYSDTVGICASVRDLDSFKEKRLTRVLEKFIDWQVHVNDYTYSDAPNKDFRFEQEVILPEAPHKFTIYVTVYAYVRSDSPLCRIVTTGFTEEVVRKEVKTIVCA